MDTYCECRRYRSFLKPVKSHGLCSKNKALLELMDTANALLRIILWRGNR